MIPTYIFLFGFRLSPAALFFIFGQVATLVGDPRIEKLSVSIDESFIKVSLQAGNLEPKSVIDLLRILLNSRDLRLEVRCECLLDGWIDSVEEFRISGNVFEQVILTRRIHRDPTFLWIIYEARNWEARRKEEQVALIRPGKTSSEKFRSLVNEFLTMPYTLTLPLSGFHFADNGPYYFRCQMRLRVIRGALLFQHPGSWETPWRESEKFNR